MTLQRSLTIAQKTPRLDGTRRAAAFGVTAYYTLIGNLWKISRWEIIPGALICEG